MTPTDDTWQFHLSMMQSEPTTPLRAEAFEVFMAEAARVRLHERCGPARVHMRSGTVIAGELASPADGAVEGHVLLVDDEGRHMLLPVASVSAVVGASVALRDESTRRRARSFASCLRDCWAAGERLRVLLEDGRWIDGVIALVASDHVELSVGDERWVIPFVAGQAWDVGRAA